MSNEKDKKSFKDFLNEGGSFDAFKNNLQDGKITQQNADNAENVSDPDADVEPEVVKLFATIHHQSDHRPDGYTAEQLAEINRKLNEKPE